MGQVGRSNVLENIKEEMMFRKFIYWGIIVPGLAFLLILFGPWVVVYALSYRFVTGKGETKLINYLDKHLTNLGTWFRIWARREDTPDWKILKGENGDQ